MCSELTDLLASHDARCVFGQGDASCLGRERHGSRSTRVELDDKDVLVADSVLDVQETSNAAGKRQLFGDGPNLVNNLFREREGRPAASGVARVNTALFDVLQDGAYVALLGVAESVNVQLNGVLEEGV